MKKIFIIIILVSFIGGCVSVGKSNHRFNTNLDLPLGKNLAYGFKPNAYQRAIKNYFSTKLIRGEQGQYRFSEPKRAYKQKGLAYGGELAWKGWLVETSVFIPSRTGRYLSPKPYLVLFKGEQIVEYILGSSHKLLTKVDQ